MRRLKAALGVREDQEVAKALGMTKAALSLRKKRGTFPSDKLVALSASRPDLAIDVSYIVSGVHPRPGRSVAVEDGLLRVLGALPAGTVQHQELLLDLATRLAGQLRVLRAERAAVYEAILVALDKADIATVNTVRELADRMATADREKRQALLKAGSSGAGPTAGALDLLDRLEWLVTKAGTGGSDETAPQR